MENIHECDFKKGKMWDIEENSGGEFFCARCRKKIDKQQIHSDALKRRRNEYLRLY
jgi:hypothetical protein